jgi:hypothetical protein
MNMFTAIGSQRERSLHKAGEVTFIGKCGFALQGIVSAYSSQMDKRSVQSRSIDLNALRPTSSLSSLIVLVAFERVG